MDPKNEQPERGSRAVEPHERGDFQPDAVPWEAEAVVEATEQEERAAREEKELEAEEADTP